MLTMYGKVLLRLRAPLLWCTTEDKKSRYYKCSYLYCTVYDKPHSSSKWKNQKQKPHQSPSLKPPITKLIQKPKPEPQYSPSPSPPPASSDRQKQNAAPSPPSHYQNTPTATSPRSPSQTNNATAPPYASPPPSPPSDPDTDALSPPTPRLARWSSPQMPAATTARAR